MGILLIAGGSRNLEKLMILERYAERIQKEGGIADEDINGYTPLQAFKFLRH